MICSHPVKAERLSFRLARLTSIGGIIFVYYDRAFLFSEPSLREKFCLHPKLSHAGRIHLLDQFENPHSWLQPIGLISLTFVICRGRCFRSDSIVLNDQIKVKKKKIVFRYFFLFEFGISIFFIFYSGKRRYNVFSSFLLDLSQLPMPAGTGGAHRQWECRPNPLR